MNMLLAFVSLLFTGIAYDHPSTTPWTSSISSLGSSIYLIERYNWGTSWCAQKCWVSIAWYPILVCLHSNNFVELWWYSQYNGSNVSGKLVSLHLIHRPSHQSTEDKFDGVYLDYWNAQTASAKEIGGKKAPKTKRWLWSRRKTSENEKKSTRQ